MVNSNYVLWKGKHREKLVGTVGQDNLTSLHLEIPKGLSNFIRCYLDKLTSLKLKKQKGNFHRFKVRYSIKPYKLRSQFRDTTIGLFNHQHFIKKSCSFSSSNICGNLFKFFHGNMGLSNRNKLASIGTYI